MANPIKGEVSLHLSDGREFILVGGFRAGIEAEELCGKPVAQIASDAQAGSMTAIRALFYGMVKSRQPEITLDEVTDLLDDDMVEIEKAMTRAVELAARKREDGDGGNPQRPRPRGKTSGRSGAKRG